MVLLTGSVLGVTLVGCGVKHDPLSLLKGSVSDNPRSGLSETRLPTRTTNDRRAFVVLTGCGGMGKKDIYIYICQHFRRLIKLIEPGCFDDDAELTVD